MSFRSRLRLCLYDDGFFRSEIRFNQNMLEGNNFSWILDFKDRLALLDINDQSYNKHMKNLQSRPWRPRPGPAVSIHPKWFSGTENEVNRHFSDFKQIFADDDLEMTAVIDHIKNTRNVPDTGKLNDTDLILQNYVYCESPLC